jgi:hypothetical protein
MNSHKKVTYTLPKAVINTVKKNSSISMSRWLSESIQNGYEMMIDGYYDNGKQPLVGIKRRRNGTIPKTFSIPIKVDDTLRWFSETLNVRTSHLVVVCVLNYNHRNSEGNPLRIEELLRMMDEIYGGTYRESNIATLEKHC